MSADPRRRIAVVGSGVAGLTAAYVASRTADVTLYEADDRLGGHAHTHSVPEELPTGTRELRIDTGFIVHNPRTYPVLLRLFAELGVRTQASEMSMSIRDDESGLEWAGALGREGLFPTSANLRKPRYLAMLAEIPRFHRRAKALVEGADDDRTLREFLADGRFSAYFVRHFMEPLVAAVWSCEPGVALDYPARYLFTFLQHHGMLGIFGSPQWRTVTGGSHEYVDRVAEQVSDVRVGSKVTSVLETGSGVEITDGNGRIETFDGVVIATHPAQALSMLAEPTTAQRDVLGAMPYSPNSAVLHTDTSILPEATNAHASWNFRRLGLDKLDQRGSTADRAASAASARRDQGLDKLDQRGTLDQHEGLVVTYDLTRLQRLDTDTQYLVTLGAEELIDESSIIARMEYEHPLYNPTSVAAQARLPELNTDRLVFAGAYHGWGFHEDGARSGLAAATHLGLPWPETSVPVARSEASTGIYETVITHQRRKPFKRRFVNHSHTWLVDLDDLPDHGVLGRFESRDHLGETRRSIKENVVAFLARHDVSVGHGQILMATQPRAFGHCFNPLTVFWCFDESGAQVATVLEVHNTYGDRHAYLFPPHSEAVTSHETSKQMYVSPFHGVDGTYRVVAPAPTDRFNVVVELTTDAGERFTATMSGNHAPEVSTFRAARASLRTAALIRVHGVWLWLRRLPVHARPTHHQAGVQELESPKNSTPTPPTSRGGHR